MAKGFPTPRKWRPKNPQKYSGDFTAIISRSSWETKFMNWADRTESVVLWSSEEVVIPYICATDNFRHRYFVDFSITVKGKTGEIKKYLVEIKPKAQTIPPVAPKKKTKRYVEEVLTYAKNVSKWKAAELYASQRGYAFIILTEDHLGIK